MYYMSDLISHCEAPLNVFKNQIVISKGKELTVYEEPQTGYHSHYVKLPDISINTLTRILKDNLHPNVANGVKIPEKYIQLL